MCGPQGTITVGVEPEFRLCNLSLLCSVVWCVCFFFNHLIIFRRRSDPAKTLSRPHEIENIKGKAWCRIARREERCTQSS